MLGENTSIHTTNFAGTLSVAFVERCFRRLPTLLGQKNRGQNTKSSDYQQGKISYKTVESIDLFFSVK